jgi:hypothetical protein
MFPRQQISTAIESKPCFNRMQFNTVTWQSECFAWHVYTNREFITFVIIWCVATLMLRRLEGPERHFNLVVERHMNNELERIWKEPAWPHPYINLEELGETKGNLGEDSHSCFRNASRPFAEYNCRPALLKHPATVNSNMVSLRTNWQLTQSNILLSRERNEIGLVSANRTKKLVTVSIKQFFPHQFNWGAGIGQPV